MSARRPATTKSVAQQELCTCVLAIQVVFPHHSNSRPVKLTESSAGVRFASSRIAASFFSFTLSGILPNRCQERSARRCRLNFAVQYRIERLELPIQQSSLILVLGESRSI